MIAATLTINLSHTRVFLNSSSKSSTRYSDNINFEEKNFGIPNEYLKPNEFLDENREYQLYFDLQQEPEKIKIRTEKQNSFKRRDSTDYGTVETNTLMYEQNLSLDSQKSSAGSQPFVFLEQAKSLLNEQRIQDACSTLQRGADLYPKDNKIAHLLRAISPGRVTNVKGTAPNRSKEVAWIRRHGNKYRGQWVAINGDDLLATATSLNTLLKKIQRNDKGNSPLVHYFVPD